MRNFPLTDGVNVTRDPSDYTVTFSKTLPGKVVKKPHTRSPAVAPAFLLTHAVIMAEAAEEDNGMEALKRTMQYPLIKVRAEPTRSRLRLRCSPSAEHALTRGGLRS